MLSAVWKYVSGGLLFLTLMLGLALHVERIHSHKLEKRVTELTAKLDQIDRDARKAKADGDRLSKELKERTDEENRRIAGDAGSLRVSGPGKAVCRPAPAAPGGHEQAAPKTDAPGPALPPDDRAAVPWEWLTERSQEHDQALIENKAWREWYDRLVASWPKK